MTKISHVNISPLASGFTMNVYYKRDANTTVDNDDRAYTNADDLLRGLRELLGVDDDTPDANDMSPEQWAALYKGVPDGYQPRKSPTSDMPGAWPEPDPSVARPTLVLQDTIDIPWRNWKADGRFHHPPTLCRDDMIRVMLSTGAIYEGKADIFPWRETDDRLRITLFKKIPAKSPTSDNDSLTQHLHGDGHEEMIGRLPGKLARGATLSTSDGQPDADGWIPWHGQGLPSVSRHEKVMVKFKDGTRDGPFYINDFNWRHGEAGVLDIIAYKLTGADL